MIFILVGVLILARNPKDMAKDSPLDYFGFGIALVGGLPIWIGLLLVLIIILLTTMGLWELKNADF